MSRSSMSNQSPGPPLRRKMQSLNCRAPAIAQFHAAAFPAAIDRLPAVVFPDALLDEKIVAFHRAAGVAVVADQAIPHRPGDASTAPGHFFDQAMVEIVVLPVQNHSGPLREVGRVAKDESAHSTSCTPSLDSNSFTPKSCERVEACIACAAGSDPSASQR
jgi:hypothetical protein